MTQRPFHLYPFFGIDGSILMANCGTRAATARDMNLFFKVAEPDLDRLTLEMCQDERSQGKVVPEWLLEAELDAFRRTRLRAA